MSLPLAQMYKTTTTEASKLRVISLEEVALLSPADAAASAPKPKRKGFAPKPPATKLDKIKDKAKKLMTVQVRRRSPPSSPSSKASEPLPKGSQKKPEAKVTVPKEETGAERQHRLAVFTHLSACNAVFNYKDHTDNRVKRILITSFYPHQPTAFRFKELTGDGAERVASLPSAYSRLQISSLFAR